MGKEARLAGRAGTTRNLMIKNASINHEIFLGNKLLF